MENQNGSKSSEEPLHLIRDPEPKVLAVKLVLGAALGLAAGALSYIRGQAIVGETLRLANKAIAEEYGKKEETVVKKMPSQKKH